MDTEIAHKLNKLQACISAAHDHIQLSDIGATDPHVTGALEEMLRSVRLLKLIVEASLRKEA